MRSNNFCDSVINAGKRRDYGTNEREWRDRTRDRERDVDYNRILDNERIDRSDRFRGKRDSREREREKGRVYAHRERK